MKKLFVFLIAISVLGFASCEKEETGETPGNIPGLGDTPGKPEIKEKFVLPEDIRIVGEITGFENPNQLSPDLKSAGNYKLPIYGSGSDVKLKLTLRNDGKKKRTLFLPKGLIWENKTGEYQHGLQIQTIWICLNPGETRQVTIRLYCANLNWEIPNQNGVYNILGVTSSKIIWKLLDLIGWKMVNYEMIKTENDLKSGNSPSFDEITDRLQKIIHNLTDTRKEIDEEDIKFIESIPNVENEAALAVLKNTQYKEDIDEYSELVKK